MPLDPQVKAMLDAMPPEVDFDSLPLAVLRESMSKGTLSPGEPEPVAQVEDRTLPGPAGEIPVRVYTPAGEGPFPVTLYFHGGGFVFCGLDSHDGPCRSLANRAGCVVVSVDYRLAPEHVYPAGPEDCYAATCWVAGHGGEIGADGSRIAVAGDSAGGNMAAAVTLMARDRDGPELRFQLLVYPVTHFDFGTASYRENAEGYFLSQAMMRWFWNQYLEKPQHGLEAYASPLLAGDLAGLPPGLCITAEFDPLRDEGERYAERLRAAGVDVPTTRYDGMIHGFFGMSAIIDRSRDAVEESAAALRAALA